MIINFYKGEAGSGSGVTPEYVASAITSAITTETGRTESTYQHILTAGENITISGNIISATGGGSAEQPNEEIWYWGEEEVTLDQNARFYADAECTTELSIVSHTYDEDTKKGVIKFDGDVVCVGENVEDDSKGGTSSYYGLYGCSFYKVSLPASVKILGQSAFDGCQNLMEVNIPYGVEKICNYAFYNDEQLIGIILPPTLKEIDYEAFYWCSALSFVNMPSELELIGKEAFYSCKKLAIDLDIPDTVTYIGDKAFQYAGIRSVTASMYYDSEDDGFGEYIFDGCDNLEKAVMNGDYIPSCAFNNCINLKKIEMDYVSYFGDYCFGYVPAELVFNNINLMDGQNIFDIASLANPDKIKVAEGDANYDSRENCGCLIETATDKIIRGSKHCFIPSSVTEIDAGAFGHFSMNYYADWTDVDLVIPDSVETVDSSAFVDSVYHSLTFKSETPYDDILFSGDFPIYVPASAVEDYKEAWADYADRIFPISNTVASTSVATIWKGTQAQYDAIATKDPNTLYIIKD